MILPMLLNVSRIRWLADMACAYPVILFPAEDEPLLWNYPPFESFFKDSNELSLR